MNDFLNLPPLRKPRQVKAKQPQVSAAAKLRYQQAHERNFNKVAHAAGHYFAPKMPDCNKANGLQLAIQNFLKWNGHRATRISSAGRKVNGKWIPGPTRKGSSDVSSTINGRSAMFEVKVGKDTASEYQLKEQDMERKAGGIYEFVKTFDEFLKIYDEQKL